MCGLVERVISKSDIEMARSWAVADDITELTPPFPPCSAEAKTLHGSLLDTHLQTFQLSASVAARLFCHSLSTRPPPPWRGGSTLTGSKNDQLFSDRPGNDR